MTLAIFLYIYYAFLVFWSIMVIVALFHILSYGVKNLITFFATMVFVGVAGLMLSSSFYYINQVDWTTPISFFDIDFDFQSININSQ